MNPELLKTLEAAAHEFLLWVGFGTLVGLAAKAIMPGRDPGGAVATLMMGITGSVIGCAVLSFFWEGHTITPISPLGFACGTAGAFMLLAFYRLMTGYFFIEAGTDNENANPRRGSRNRRRAYARN